MDLEETRAFLAVIDHGSFKAAAETLNQPRATLRRRVESLEARVGVTLLDRSRHGVEPTAAGQLLARHGRGLLRETQALLHALRELEDDTPRGDLRVGIPVGLPADAVALVFGLFRAKFPQLRLDLRVATDPATELLDQVEVALAWGPERGRVPTNARWSTTVLAELREGLVATTSYLARHGTPRSLAQLGDHEQLAIHATTSWPLITGGQVTIQPAMLTEDEHQLRRLASLGYGIALLTDVELGEAESDDPLVGVLADQVGRSRTLFAMVPEVLAETPKLQAIVAHLQRCFASRPRRIDRAAAERGRLVSIGA